MDSFEGDCAGLRANGQHAIMDFGVKVFGHVRWNSIAELVEIFICHIASDDRGIPYVGAGVHELYEWAVVGITNGTRLVDGRWERLRGARYKFVDWAEVDHATAANHTVINHTDLLCRAEGAGVHGLGGEAQF